MDLSFYPVASSSKGNCYIIRSESTNIMVDIGITIRALRGYFSNINLDITEHRIDGLLVTHEHIDHVRNVNNIMTESLKCNLFCSKGTGEAISQKMKKVDPERVNYIEKNQTFMVGDIEVTAFGICHDAAEPLSYTFSKNGKKISIITDTGKMDEEMDEAIADSDVLIIESNHEVNILLYGRYPYHVKRRILSDVGHLSNEACGEAIARFLKNQTKEKVPQVLLAHLSQENNTPEQALLTVKNVLEENDFYVGRHLRIGALKPNDENDYIVI